MPTQPTLVNTCLFAALPADMQLQVCYTVPMAVTRIGTADDREAWLEQRKGYLTASSIFTWRGVDVPKWWGDTREDIIAEKFCGKEKVFPPAAVVAMAHGSFDENNIGRKLELALGAAVVSTNDMFTNTRWEGLAATIDGFITPMEGEYVEANFCQEEGHMQQLHAALETLDEQGVMEIKKSVSAGWQTGVPDYYVSQLQTQMAILNLDYGVICAETIKREGRRTYWDLRPYLVFRDPDWDAVLDKCNEEFLSLKEEYK